MILTSWKEIASRLHCAVRTAQRWERNGLPVNRPLPGRRSCVTADAESLDSWLRNDAFGHRDDLGRLGDILRSRQLRSQSKHARDLLRKNLALLRGQRELLQHRIVSLQDFRTLPRRARGKIPSAITAATRLPMSYKLVRWRAAR